MANRYGLVIDLERCIGCHTCTVSCKIENSLEKGSGIRVETIGGPRTDTPSGKAPRLGMHFLPIPCMHCDEPPCREACPLEVIVKREDGILTIDKDQCDGCRICASECPYDAILFDEERNIVLKCTFCVHRLEEGLQPFCVVCCQTEALSFGDINDTQSMVSQLIAKRNAVVLKSENGTRPAVYYCSTSKGEVD